MNVSFTTVVLENGIRSKVSRMFVVRISAHNGIRLNVTHVCVVLNSIALIECYFNNCRVGKWH